MGSGAKLLAIDDESEFMSNLQTVMKRKGYRVLTALNKIRAQEVVRHEKPDLVILGTITPRGDAFLLHQWLKRSPRFKDLPLIVIDAPPEMQLIKGWNKDEGLRLEAEDYFRKPVEPAALIPFIEKLLDRETKKIRVLVVDDHTVVREGIRILLNLQKDIEVVGEAIDGRDAIDKTLKLLPDVVLMDIVMPGMNGLEATKVIHREHEDTEVLILTQYDDPENILASRKAGALDVIPKRNAGSQLLSSIRFASRRDNHSYKKDKDM